MASGVGAGAEMAVEGVAEAGIFASRRRTMSQSSEVYSGAAGDIAESSSDIVSSAAEAGGAVLECATEAGGSLIGGIVEFIGECIAGICDGL